MSNVRVVINRRGIRELLRSEGVLADLARRGDAIAQAAGPGHKVEKEIGRNRARVAIHTDTIEAAISETRHHTLLNAIDAGRD